MKKRGKKENSFAGGHVCELVCKEEMFCWIPRSFALMFIAFISLFALDVIGEGYDIGEMIIPLLIHLIPAIVLIMLLQVSWKYEKIGGALFILAGFVFTIFFNTYQELVTFLLISGPPFFIGVLFWVSAVKKGKRF